MWEPRLGPRVLPPKLEPDCIRVVGHVLRNIYDMLRDTYDMLRDTYDTLRWRVGDVGRWACGGRVWVCRCCPQNRSPTASVWLVTCLGTHMTYLGTHMTCLGTHKTCLGTYMSQLGGAWDTWGGGGVGATFGSAGVAPKIRAQLRLCGW